MTSDTLQSFTPVVSGIESRHRGVQRLGGTDIGRSLLPFDMLFASLQSQTQSMISLRIDRHADNTSHDITLVLLFRRHVSGVRSTVRHRDTETLGSTHRHVGTPFSRGGQQHEAHHVGDSSHQRPVSVRTIGKSFIIPYFPVSGRVLHYSTEYIRCKFKSIIVTVNQLYSLRLGTGNQHVLRLREHLVIHEQFIRPDFLHLLTAQTIHHGHSFGSSRSLVQQRTVGNLHPGQLDYHRLEIQQRLETSLRNLRLIGSV